MNIMKIKNDEHEHEVVEEANVMFMNKTIYLFGEINPSSTGSIIAAINQADSTPGPIDLYICSMGGWVEGGLAIFDAIRATVNEVTTIGCGAIYSSAIMPFMAGDHRLMQQSASLFFHDISVGVGEARLSTIKSVTKGTEHLYSIYCNNVAGRSKLKVSQVKDLCINETYVGSKECLKLGLTQDIIKFNNKKLALKDL